MCLIVFGPPLRNIHGAALYEWLTLHATDDSARYVADGTIVLMLLLLTELARRFLAGIE